MDVKLLSFLNRNIFVEDQYGPDCDWHIWENIRLMIKEKHRGGVVFLMNVQTYAGIFLLTFNPRTQKLITTEQMTHSNVSYAGDSYGS